MNVSLRSNHPFDAHRCLIAAAVILRESAQFWMDAADDKDLSKMLRTQALAVLASAERLRYLYEVQFQNPWPQECEGMEADELAARQRLEGAT